MSATPLPDDQPEGLPPPRGDLTQGPILRTLVLFAMPAMLANLLQTLGGTINTIWVGQLLGEGALAATANANIIVFLAFAVVFGFGMASTVRIGQNFGARDGDAARRTFGTGIGFCTALAFAGALFGFATADPVLRLMATPESIHDQALIYLQVSFLSLPLGTLGMMVSMGLRGVGDARTPLYSMVISTVLAIALNPLFILGYGPVPALGIGGSALANLLAGAIGAVWMVGWMYWRDLPLRLRGPEWRYLLPVRDDLAYILGKGLPMGAQMLITSAAAVIMVGLVNREGMLTTAAYGAVLQIWNYIQMPAFAISMAVSAMVAQNIGAGKHERVGRITLAGVATNTLVTVVLSGLLLLLDAPLLGLFLGSGSQAIPLAEHIQNIATSTWVFSGVMMILSGTLRAYGVVIVPLIIMVVSQYLARLGFYFVFYPQMGIDALWWSYPFGGLVALVMTWWTYARGRWRRVHLPAAMHGA